MWVWFWITGALAVYLTALSNVFLARGTRSGLVGRRVHLELRVALSLSVAVASSLASLSFFSSSLFSASPPAQGVGHPLAWALLGGLVWLLLVLACAIALPLRLARALGAEGPARALASGATRFFVLPIGRAAARIARNAAGPATSRLEEGYARELCAVFSRDPSDALRSEPLASVVKEFTRTTVEDIMVPRSAMVAVASSSTLAECVDVFATKRFSRLPVYEGDVESIIGIVRVMDLLKENDLTKTVSQIVRPVPMVPESKNCGELLKEFQKSHGYMAIVLDEYGGIAGLVTVEDVLEELVGEMGHEPVSPRRAVHRAADGTFLAPAQIEIDKFESATGMRLPRGDYETLAGYLLQEFGRIPEVGASVRRGGVLYEVVEADVRKIKLVKVRAEVDALSGKTGSA
ncbi:MAG: hemolysin family protein [Candidatus Eisenbacteria bacterium]|nr:hemolysin family protein [Candidatus Eisenbacteria bacterium]